MEGQETASTELGIPGTREDREMAASSSVADSTPVITKPNIIWLRIITPEVPAGRMTSGAHQAGLPSCVLHSSTTDSTEGMLGPGPGQLSM